jgi:hypothetical protein
MSRRPQSSWGSMINAGSNLYQNKQLADQSRALNAQNQMMEQQLLMQQMEQMKKEMIIEKRKMLMSIHLFLDKVDRTYQHHLEYAWTMTSMVADQVQGQGLSSRDFEDVVDMEKANQIQTRLFDSLTNIQTQMNHQQNENAARMKSIIIKEENELENLVLLFQQKEDWESNRIRFEKIDPIHRKIKKTATIFFAITLSIALFGLIGMAASLGECIEYNADNTCDTYENDGNIIAGVGAIVGTLSFLVALVGGIPYGLKANKYRTEWHFLNDKKVLSEQGAFIRNSLSNTYLVHNSKDAFGLRNSLVGWVDSLSPSDPSMILSLN